MYGTLFWMGGRWVGHYFEGVRGEKIFWLGGGGWG